MASSAVARLCCSVAELSRDSEILPSRCPHRLTDAFSDSCKVVVLAEKIFLGRTWQNKVLVISQANRQTCLARQGFQDFTWTGLKEGSLTCLENYFV